MIKEFNYYEVGNLEEMESMVLEMHVILEKFKKKEIPNADYSLADLTMFCKSLVNNQRCSDQRPDKSYIQGSWSVAPVGANERNRFIFIPTYIAVSILSKFMQVYPENASSISGYKTALLRGLVYSVRRQLAWNGDGSKVSKRSIEAIEILDMGDVPDLLSTEKQLCPALFFLLKDIRKQIASSLKNNNGTKWDEESKERYKSIYKALDVLNSNDEVILDDVAEVISGVPLRKYRTNSSCQEYFLVSRDELTNHRIISHPSNTVVLPESEYEKFKLQAGDIVLSVSWDKIALVPESYNAKWVIIGLVYIIRLKPNTVIKSASVLMWYLELVIKEQVLAGKIGSGHSRLNRAQIRSLEIKSLTVEQQNKIIGNQNKISLIDEEIVNSEGLSEEITTLVGLSKVCQDRIKRILLKPPVPAIDDLCNMPHIEYLGDLPETVQEIFSAITGNFFDAFDLFDRLAVEAENQIENRYEISLSLLNGFDLIEIAVQKSMVPSQKAEFSWHLYNRYFQVLVKLLQTVVNNNNSDDVEEILSFLVSKLKYELKRRESVIEKGGDHELKRILRPVRHLI